MRRVFDLEGSLPGEGEEFVSSAANRLGPDSPNRLALPPSHGLANYGNIFASRRDALASNPQPPGSSGQSLAALVAELEAAGVVHSVIESTRAPNRIIAEAVRAFPHHFVGLAYLSPYDGMRASRELERLVREDGFAGLFVSALTDVLPASDRRYYPLYAKCVELEIPVRIYTSMNYATDRPYDLGHPRHLDQVASDFPELTIIAGLSGWPWVNDMVALLRRHANLYADTAAHRPRYFNTPGSGWEQFLHFGNSVLQDKVMVGLSRGLLGMPVGAIIEEYAGLSLKQTVLEKWLYANAVRVFGLD